MKIMAFSPVMKMISAPFDDGALIMLDGAARLTGDGPITPYLSHGSLEAGP